MTLGDFIKSGGWDKVKFRDASGFANFDFKYTTRKRVSCSCSYSIHST